jgi:hypothetical protein
VFEVADRLGPTRYPGASASRSEHITHSQALETARLAHGVGGSESHRDFQLGGGTLPRYSGLEGSPRDEHVQCLALPNRPAVSALNEERPDIEW